MAAPLAIAVMVGIAGSASAQSLPIVSVKPLRVVIDQPIGPAAVIYEQKPDGSNALVAQDFTDFPSFSTTEWDDFVIPGQTTLGRSTAFGLERGNSQANHDVISQVWTGLPDRGGVLLAMSSSGVQSGQDLIGTFGGEPLIPGVSYWHSAWVVRGLAQGGQWFWQTTREIRGSEEQFWNPGGGFGFGKDSIDGSKVFGEPYDLGFRLEDAGPPPVGACCLPQGKCENLTAEECQKRGGQPQPPGTRCPDDGFFRPQPDQRGNQMVVPLDWLPKVKGWSLDKNGNSVDDDIESVPPNKRVNILLGLNYPPSDADIARFAAVGTIGYRSKYLPIVALQGVLGADAVALGADPRVALVELDRQVFATTDKSIEAMKVKQGFYSPNTVEDLPSPPNGAGASIAIIDTGVDDGVHLALPSSIFVGGFNVFTNTYGNPDDDHSHGTHVAGIALGRPLGGFRGVATGAKLVDIKALDSSGSGTWAGVIQCVDVCIQQRIAWNIKVVNMSLGGGASNNGMGTLEQLINYGTWQGLVFSIAMGNSGIPMVPSPASADLAISVASASYLGTVNRVDDLRSSFSNQGPRPSDGDADTHDELKPDVTCYGSDNQIGSLGVWSAMWNTTNQYLRLAGTSMAAPHVAGLAALIADQSPTTPPLTIKQAILMTAEDRGTSGWDIDWGYGLVDAHKAVVATRTPVTDLGFVGYIGYQPTWWFSPSVVPCNPFITESQANGMNVTVNNFGGTHSGPFRIHVGVYDFSNSMAYTPVFTHVDSVGIPPGGFKVYYLNSGLPNVCTGWMPKVLNGPLNTMIHACIHAEIIYPSDTNFGNNKAQHNVQILNTIPDPTKAAFNVYNYTDDVMTIRLRHNRKECEGGLSVRFPENDFVMQPGEGPRHTEVEFDWRGTQHGAELVPIAVIGVDANGKEFDLGGVAFGVQVGEIQDCNKNGVSDALDIVFGHSRDDDGDGVPDDCKPVCYADCDGNGRLDIRDFFCFQGKYAAGDRYADCDGNGRLDIRDFFCFQGKYAQGCR